MNRLHVKTDSGDADQADDIEDNLECLDHSEHSYDYSMDEILDECDCFHQKKIANCDVCPIFEEPRLQSAIGDAVTSSIVQYLKDGILYAGDSHDCNEEDRFYVYQCGPGQYAILDEHRYTDEGWDVDPVIDSETISSGNVITWY